MNKDLRQKSGTSRNDHPELPYMREMENKEEDGSPKTCPSSGLQQHKVQRALERLPQLVHLAKCNAAD